MFLNEIKINDCVTNVTVISTSKNVFLTTSTMTPKYCNVEIGMIGCF